MNYDWEKVLDYDYDILCTQNPELSMVTEHANTAQSSVSALAVSGRGPLDACVAAKNAQETRLRGSGPGLAKTRDKTPHLIQTRGP